MRPKKQEENQNRIFRVTPGSDDRLGASFHSSLDAHQLADIGEKAWGSLLSGQLASSSVDAPDGWPSLAGGMFRLSCEGVVEGFLENPYWQYFVDGAFGASPFAGFQFDDALAQACRLQGFEDLFDETLRLAKERLI